MPGRPAYYGEIKGRQQKWAGYWGNLDGCTHERMIGLFDRLIAERNSPKA